MIKNRLPQLNLSALLGAALLVPVLGVVVAAQGASVKPPTQYQIQLRSQVDNVNGSPRDGRDPASQMQTSLSAAGSKPEGIGTRVEKPAADVKGDKNHHVNPATVLPAKTADIYFNGCLKGFAKPGQTCVTAHMPDTNVVDCATSKTACTPALKPKQP